MIVCNPNLIVTTCTLKNLPTLNFLFQRALSLGPCQPNLKIKKLCYFKGRWYQPCGVPLGPLAISSLAFLFENKNARFSHLNLKRVWNLRVLNNVRLENARERGRGSEISPSPSLSRILEPRVFKCGLNEKPRVFISNKKARLEIASGPNGTPYNHVNTLRFFFQSD